VLVLGAAYKKDVDDLRESPSLRVITLLKERGAEVAYHDPFTSRVRAEHGFAWDMESVPLTEQALAAQDAVVILTDHSVIDYGWVVKHARLVVDTRNATRSVGSGRERIIKA
jgi:UDP-N-acetyl-D-glucosamine dehydrogenase